MSPQPAHTLSARSLWRICTEWATNGYAVDSERLRNRLRTNAEREPEIMNAANCLQRRDKSNLHVSETRQIASRQARWMRTAIQTGAKKKSKDYAAQSLVFANNRVSLPNRTTSTKPTIYENHLLHLPIVHRFACFVAAHYSHRIGHHRGLAHRRCAFLGILSGENLVAISVLSAADTCKSARA